MELRQLRYFIEIIKAHSYSHAAKNLFVTQPTLSWNMSKLQEEIGTKLLYQVGNKVMPTTAGNLLFKRGQTLLAELDDLVETIALDPASETTELVIGSNAVITLVMMPLIQTFVDRYPNLSITIEEAGSLKVQQKVAKGELEIGIVSFPILSADLEIERNIHHPFHYDAYLLMHEQHPLAHAKRLSLKELKDETFCSMSRDYVLWQVLKDRSREQGFTPKIGLMSNNHEVIVDHLLKYHSVAIMPIQLKELYGDKPLVWIPLKDKLKPFDIVMVHQKNNPLSPAAALCLEFMTNEQIPINDMP